MPTNARIRSFSLSALTALVCAACNWVSLATNALTYDEVRRGETANIVAHDSLYYATLAEDGLAVVDGRTGGVRATVRPASDDGSVDDLAIDGELLFVLDARPPGSLAVYSLHDPLRPRLISPPQPVPVGPFSGVSAAAGLCVVSGGTSELTAWTYDSAGTLSGPVATADLGRGQPDVLVTPDHLVLISTHYRGPYFGLGLLRFDSVARRLDTITTIPLNGAGFTTGGARPANFPIEAAGLDGAVFLIAHERGVSVIDASDAAGPRLTGLVDVGGPAINVDALGAWAAVAVAGEDPAVVLLEVSGTNVRVVQRHPLPPGTFPGGVALSPASVAVAARNRGVLVFRR